MSTEIIDTIRTSGSAYIVDLLCEGEIEDLVRLYIDETEYNTGNYPTISFDKSTYFRNGKKRTEQTVLPSRYSGAKTPLLIPASSRLRKLRPITLTFNSNTYPDATSILVNIKIPSLIRQVTKDFLDAPTDYVGSLSGWKEGDIRQAKVEYKITLTENGVEKPPVTEVIWEKSVGGIIWSTRLALTPNAALLVNRWSVRIERVTEDSTLVSLSNETHLDSAIIETNYGYNYSNTALSSLAFDASNFPSIGQRAYDLKLLKIKIPVGYVPTQYDENRNVVAAATYPYLWQGDFQEVKMWTDNPAWIFYDLITNKRYGLGEYINPESIDKWTLYSIAKYCDELVDNGSGQTGLLGLEPRFACNLFLTASEEAYTVVNNLASVFRGVTYWMSGKIFPVQDKPKCPTQLFTNANVVEGSFSYSSSGKNQRRTAVQVRWNDPENFYRPQIEYVEDTEGVIRYGVKEFDIAAFACTSRGQAHRVGKWALLSEKLETEVVNFETGYEGIYSRPGDIIQVYDDFRSRVKQGGRIVDILSGGYGANSIKIVLDRNVESGLNRNYKISVSRPRSNKDPSYQGADSGQMVTNDSQIPLIRNSFIEESDVLAMRESGNYTVCDVYKPSGFFLSDVVGNSWILQTESGRLYPESSILVPAVSSPVITDYIKNYRILNIKETDSKTLGVSALEYSLEKFSLAESGFTTRVSAPTDYSQYPIAAPTNLIIQEMVNPNSEDRPIYIDVKWTPSTGQFVSFHIASGRKLPTGNWDNLQTINDREATYFPSASGDYQILVAAVQAGGVISAPVSGTISYALTNPFGPSVIPIGDIVLENADTISGNVYSVPSPTFSITVLPSGTPDPRHGLLAYIQFRINDSGGAPKSAWNPTQEDEAFTIANNSSGISGWPFRYAKIEAQAVDLWNNLSALKTFSFSNPPPSSSTFASSSVTVNGFSYVVQSNSVLPSDYNGVFFSISGSGLGPTGLFTGLRPDLVGSLSHNLGVSGVYVSWGIADTFSNKELNMGGPVLVNA